MGGVGYLEDQKTDPKVFYHRRMVASTAGCRDVVLRAPGLGVPRVSFLCY